MRPEWISRVIVAISRPIYFHFFFSLFRYVVLALVVLCLLDKMTLLHASTFCNVTFLLWRFLQMTDSSCDNWYFLFRFRKNDSDCGSWTRQVRTNGFGIWNNNGLLTVGLFTFRLFLVCLQSVVVRFNEFFWLEKQMKFKMIVRRM